MLFNSFKHSNRATSTSLAVQPPTPKARQEHDPSLLSTTVQSGAESKPNAFERFAAMDLFEAGKTFNRMMAAALAAAIMATSFNLSAGESPAGAPSSPAPAAVVATTPAPASVSAIPLDQRQDYLDNVNNDLLEKSPTFKAAYMEAMKTGVSFNATVGPVTGSEIAHAATMSDGSVSVVVDFDRIAAHDESVVRIYAHEIKHVRDSAVNPAQYKATLKYEQRQGLSYHNRTAEKAAFSFADVVYNEYRANGGKLI